MKNILATVMGIKNPEDISSVGIIDTRVVYVLKNKKCEINIHELAYKCKEKMYLNFNIDIMSGRTIGKDYYICIVYDGGSTPNEFKCKTETDAIFEAFNHYLKYTS